MRDFISLFINGKPVDVRGEDALLTLSDYLRKRQHLTGTKVVCAEGDCGSCSVLIGRVEDPHPNPLPEYRARGPEIRYRAITSCIVSMYQLDAAHVVTVEGLKDGDDLNPIQKAMVECHGAQCGFCTPGFIVALQQVFEEDRHASRDKVCRGLVGNLCRCTGYDSILKAAEQTDRSALKSLEQRYPPSRLVEQMRARQTEEVGLRVGDKQLYKPATLAHALAFRSANPGCTIINGATDWGVLLNKRVKANATALVLTSLPQQTTITTNGNTLRVGPCATLSDLERAANEHLPALGEFLQWFGSPPIKNGGTLAGNIATGSPIGDSLPMLHVMNAEIELASVRGIRRVNVNQFYTGYRANVMAGDELISAIHLPLLESGEQLRLYKVSKRKDLDISSFGAAVWLKLDGQRIVDARVALGGVAATIVRMTRVEEHLRDQTISESLFAHAALIAWRDISPISDVRGSTQYRCSLAANIMRKLYVELTSDSEPSSNGVAAGGH